MIVVEGLGKHYGQTQALKGVSFTVREGSFFALLGPNGAGKSTTVNIISTLTRPSGGSVSVDGVALGEGDSVIRDKIGIVFQHSTLDGMLSVRENLTLRGRLYENNGNTLSARIDELAQWMEFADYLDQRVHSLSGGQRRKIDVARALLNTPKYLILDEPTTGLDPSVRKQIWKLIDTIRVKLGMTVILTTHYMEEVSDADHVVIIDHGEVVAEDSAQRLREKHAQSVLKLTAKDGAARALARTLGGHEDGPSVLVPIESPFAGVDIVQRERARITTFEIIQGSMDDVFLSLTGRRLNP